ncbi:hypothetical protein [Clostridium paraputrificum]|uniref:hypothetical protein n=1 Tax=Clostridium paraputrificum TaxID=29363 RepID=UPI00189FF7CC|nr:hypothetical protein [Clostridium paraputrificum]
MNVNELESKEQYYSLDSNNIIFTSAKSYFTYIDGLLIEFCREDVCSFIKELISKGDIEYVDTHTKVMDVYRPVVKINLIGIDSSDVVITYTFTNIHKFKIDAIEEHKVTEDYIKELVSKSTI